MKKITALILSFMFLMSAGVSASEMGDIYLAKKPSYGEIAQRLYDGGVTDNEIVSFFDDVQSEIILTTRELNSENFDSKMQDAIIVALKYSKNIPVYNAILSQFSAECYLLYGDIYGG